MSEEKQKKGSELFLGQTKHGSLRRRQETRAVIGFKHRFIETNWTAATSRQENRLPRTSLEVGGMNTRVRQTEKTHTCLPEDETVEGNAHGPQVQSLGGSEQRHGFRTHTCSLLWSKLDAQAGNAKAVALISCIHFFRLENLELPGKCLECST